MDPFWEYMDGISFDPLPDSHFKLEFRCNGRFFVVYRNPKKLSVVYPWGYRCMVKDAKYGQVRDFNFQNRVETCHISTEGNLKPSELRIESVDGYAQDAFSILCGPVYLSVLVPNLYNYTVHGRIGDVIDSRTDAGLLVHVVDVVDEVVEEPYEEESDEQVPPPNMLLYTEVQDSDNVTFSNNAEGVNITQTRVSTATVTQTVQPDDLNSVNSAPETSELAPPDNGAMLIDPCQTESNPIAAYAEAQYSQMRLPTSHEIENNESEVNEIGNSAPVLPTSPETENNESEVNEIGNSASVLSTSPEIENNESEVNGISDSAPVLLTQDKNQNNEQEMNSVGNSAPNEDELSSVSDTEAVVNGCLRVRRSVEAIPGPSRLCNISKINRIPSKQDYMDKMKRYSGPKSNANGYENVSSSNGSASDNDNEEEQELEKGDSDEGEKHDENQDSDESFIRVPEFPSKKGSKNGTKSEKRYYCELCPRNYTRWSRLQDHRKTDHGKKRKKRDLKSKEEYPCEICGKIYRHPTSLCRHKLRCKLSPKKPSSKKSSNSPSKKH